MMNTEPNNLTRREALLNALKGTVAVAVAEKSNLSILASPSKKVGAVACAVTVIVPFDQSGVVVVVAAQ